MCREGRCGRSSRDREDPGSGLSGRRAFRPQGVGEERGREGGAGSPASPLAGFARPAAATSLGARPE